MFQEAKNNVILLTEAIFDKAQALMEAKSHALAEELVKISQERDGMIARTQALDERERLLVAREAGVRSVQELAATRLAANKQLRDSLEQTEERLKAIKKELSDLKSKINNPTFQKTPLAAEHAHG